jgi:hypothetical protein
LLFGKTASHERLDRNRGDVTKLYEQLCAQINHLTYVRTDDPSKKIDASESKQLIDLIRDEAVRLAKYLKARYDERHLRLSELASAAEMTITVGAASSSALAAFSTKVINPPAGPAGPTGPTRSTGWRS